MIVELLECFISFPRIAALFLDYPDSRKISQTSNWAIFSDYPVDVIIYTYILFQVLNWSEKVNSTIFNSKKMQRLRKSESTVVVKKVCKDFARGRKEMCKDNLQEKCNKSGINMEGVHKEIV